MLEPWVDLAAARVPWPEDLNLNGIVLTPDGEHLVARQTNTGRYWRARISDGRVDEVDVEGGPQQRSDGLAITDRTLLAAVTALGQISVLDLCGDGARATVHGALVSAPPGEQPQLPVNARSHLQQRRPRI